MDMTAVKHLRALLAGLMLITWAARVEAYPAYDDGNGNGCVSCHDEFTFAGGRTLHTDHLTKFNITTSCTLCHEGRGGTTPVLTYWSDDGFGCAGCHGMDYGETLRPACPSPTSVSPSRLRTACAPSMHSRASRSARSCHFPGSPDHG